MNAPKYTPRKFPPGAPRIRELWPLVFNRVEFCAGGSGSVFAQNFEAVRGVLLTIWPTDLHLVDLGIGTRRITVGMPGGGIPLRFGLVWRLPPTAPITIHPGIGAQLVIENHRSAGHVLDAVLWCRIVELPLPGHPDWR